MSKADRTIRRAMRSAQEDIAGEIRESFKQDFAFFRDTVTGWPFGERLKFCLGVMRRKL